MSKTLSRFSISMAGDLVDRLDQMVKAQGYDNRSQAVADMVRDRLVEHHGREDNRIIAGSITLVYDHHKRGIQAQLTKIQHDFGEGIIATMHAHLDHHNCMEILAVKGKARAIRQLADRLIASKGVKHGKLTMTTTGKEFPS